MKRGKHIVCFLKQYLKKYTTIQTNKSAPLLYTFALFSFPNANISTNTAFGSALSIRLESRLIITQTFNWDDRTVIETNLSSQQ